MNVKLIGLWIAIIGIAHTGTTFAMDEAEIDNLPKKQMINQNMTSKAEQVAHAIFEFEQTQDPKVRQASVEKILILTPENDEAIDVLLKKTTTDDQFLDAFIHWVNQLNLLK